MTAASVRIEIDHRRGRKQSVPRPEAIDLALRGDEIADDCEGMTLRQFANRVHALCKLHERDWLARGAAPDQADAWAREIGAAAIGAWLEQSASNQAAWDAHLVRQARA